MRNIGKKLLIIKAVVLVFIMIMVTTSSARDLEKIVPPEPPKSGSGEPEAWIPYIKDDADAEKTGGSTPILTDIKVQPLIEKPELGAPAGGYTSGTKLNEDAMETGGDSTPILTDIKVEPLNDPDDNNLGDPRDHNPLQYNTAIITEDGETLEQDGFNSEASGNSAVSVYTSAFSSDGTDAVLDTSNSGVHSDSPPTSIVSTLQMFQQMFQEEYGFIQPLLDLFFAYNNLKGDVVVLNSK